MWQVICMPCNHIVLSWSNRTVFNRVYRIRHALFGHQNSTVSNMPPKAYFNRSLYRIHNENFYSHGMLERRCQSKIENSSRFDFRFWWSWMKQWLWIAASKKYMNKVTIYISISFMRLTLLSLVWSHSPLSMYTHLTISRRKIDRVIELMNSNNNDACQTNKINQKNNIFCFNTENWKLSVASSLYLHSTQQAMVLVLLFKEEKKKNTLKWDIDKMLILAN